MCSKQSYEQPRSCRTEDDNSTAEAGSSCLLGSVPARALTRNPRELGAASVLFGLLLWGFLLTFEQPIGDPANP